MSYITAVRVDGTPLELGRIVADVDATYGRSGVYDGPTASHARVILTGAVRADASLLVVGGRLELDGPAAVPVFRGMITDSALADDAGHDAAITLVAIGRLAELGGVPSGLVDYPAETWSARVNRVMAGSPVPFTVTVGSPDVPLAARLADPTDILAMLTELADIGGAAVYDRPDGTVVVQASSARPIGAPVTLPPDLVAYAPDWLQQIDVVNRLTVAYEGGELELVDDVSQARYGERNLSLSGVVADAAAANSRGRVALARRAWARWSSPTLELLTPAAGLAPGVLVSVPGLPASAPYPTASLMLEQLTTRVVGPDATQTLTLSDPVDSGAVLRWADVPAGHRWVDVPAATRWVDAYSLESIDASLKGVVMPV